MEATPLFTVVIPTRDRPRSVERCLAALERQDAAGPYEIIVVDDGSRDTCGVAAVVEQTPGARLVRTPPGGSVQARNRGVREARADVVLFLDDDCEPLPRWASLLLAELHGGAAVAAGRCANVDARDAYGEATQTVLDYLTVQSMDGGGSARFAPTYNLACRRELLLDLPFDARYVNAGADRDWCARLTRLGHRIVIVPHALVHHRQTLSLARFWRKHRSYGNGSARFRARNHVALEDPGFYAGLVVEGFRRGPTVGLAVCLAQIATAAGYIADRIRQRLPRPSSASGLEHGLALWDLPLEAESNADGGGDIGHSEPAARQARS